MPSPSTTCCPTGYTYINNSGYYIDPLTLVVTALATYSGHTLSESYNKCVQRQNYTPNAFGSPVNPIDCPCCPSGFVYTLYGQTVPQITGTCYSSAGSSGLAGTPFFVPDLASPIPCVTPITKCCPSGYSYVSLSSDGMQPGFFTNSVGVSTQAPVNITGLLSDICASSVYLNSQTIFFSVQIPGTQLQNSEFPTAPPIPCITCTCPVIVPFECATPPITGLPIVFQYDFSVKECTDCNPQENTSPRGCITKFLANNLVDPTIYFKLRNKNFL